MINGKPMIGVMPLMDHERDSYWMLPGYMRGLEEQGAVPLMPPLTDRPEELDCFLELCTGRSRPRAVGVSPSCGTPWINIFCSTG